MSLKIIKSEMLYRVKTYPWSATLEFTTRCNSNCSYCVRNKAVPKTADISLENLAKIVQQLRYTKVGKITLGGWGEPTLYQDFNIAVNMIKSQLPNAKLKIFTNGITMFENITALSKFDEITVSLNHSCQETYAKYNRVNMYDTVAKNVEYFLKTKGSNRPAISVQLLKTPEADEMAFTDKWMPLLNSNDHLIYQPLESQPSIPSEFYPCYDAKTLLMIDLNGDAYCCCRSWTAGKGSDVFLGNIIKDGIEKIVKSKKLLAVQNSQADGKRSKLNPCSHCDIWVKNKNQYQLFNNKWRLA